MKILHLFQQSTRFRLIAALVAMLLPVIVLAVTSFFVFNGFIDSFISVTDEMVGQIQPKFQIQGMLSEYMRDLNHFVLDSEESKKQIVLRQGDRVSKAFEKLLEISFSHKGEHKSINSAFKDWEKAKIAALELIRNSESATTTSKKSVLALDRVDLLVAHSSTTLEHANNFDLAEISTELEAARPLGVTIFYLWAWR